jgi:CheY-like chemotaxis protein
MAKNGNPSSIKNGHRLTFLVIESKPKEGLSSRKLLLESAGNNVLTSYSGKEGLEMFRRFPKVDAVCIESELHDLKGASVARQLRKLLRELRIIAVSPRVGAKYEWADATVDSHDPAALLELLQEMGARMDI